MDEADSLESARSPTCAKLEGGPRSGRRAALVRGAVREPPLAQRKPPVAAVTRSFSSIASAPIVRDLVAIGAPTALPSPYRCASPSPPMTAVRRGPSGVVSSAIPINNSAGTCGSTAAGGSSTDRRWRSVAGTDARDWRDSKTERIAMMQVGRGRLRQALRAATAPEPAPSRRATMSLKCGAGRAARARRSFLNRQHWPRQRTTLPGAAPPPIVCGQSHGSHRLIRMADCTDVQPSPCTGTARTDRTRATVSCRRFPSRAVVVRFAVPPVSDTGPSRFRVSSPQSPSSPRGISRRRLPGKALADIAGRPMIEHVYRRAAAATLGLARDRRDRRRANRRRRAALRRRRRS